MVPTKREAFTIRRKERLRKRRQICMLRLQHPGWSLKQLARGTGFTVMRCSQILREEGLPSKANPPVKIIIKKRPYRCVVCKKGTHNSLYCSNACKSVGEASLQFHLICPFCRAPFTRSVEYIMRQMARAKGRFPKLFCRAECYFNGRHEGLV